MRRIFVDMDGVLVDFDGYMLDHALTPEQIKHTPGHYISMRPTLGALESVLRLIELGYDVWIASKPPTGEPFAYSEKVSWVLRYLPELKKKIILTHDKGLLGTIEDFLIDDRPHKANCQHFKGKLIHFGSNEYPSWDWIMGAFDLDHVRSRPRRSK